MIFGQAFAIVGVALVGLWLSGGNPPPPGRHHTDGAITIRPSSPHIQHADAPAPTAERTGERTSPAPAETTVPLTALTQTVEQIKALTQSVDQIRNEIPALKSSIEQIRKNTVPDNRMQPADLKSSLDQLKTSFTETIQAVNKSLQTIVEKLSQTSGDKIQPDTATLNQTVLEQLNKITGRLDKLDADVKYRDPNPKSSWTSDLSIWIPTAATAAFVVLLLLTIVIVRWSLLAIAHSLHNAQEQGLADLGKDLEDQLRTAQSYPAAPPPEDTVGPAITVLRDDLHSALTSMQRDIRRLAEARADATPSRTTSELAQLKTEIAEITRLLRGLPAQIASTPRETPPPVVQPIPATVLPDVEIPPFSQHGMARRDGERPTTQASIPPQSQGGNQSLAIPVPESLLSWYNSVLADHSQLPEFKRKFAAVWATSSGGQLIANDQEPPAHLADGYLFVKVPRSGGGVLVPGLNFFKSRAALNDPRHRRSLFEGIFTIQEASQDRLLAPATARIGSDNRLDILRAGELQFAQ